MLGVRLNPGFVHQEGEEAQSWGGGAVLAKAEAQSGKRQVDLLLQS